MSNARDFIMFGRTTVFFVKDYNVTSGVVENVTVKEWTDEHGIRHYVDDKFTVKHKIGDNLYEYLELDKSDVFFVEDDAKNELVRLLKEYITTHNKYDGTFINFPESDELECYLYESDADIWKDEAIRGSIISDFVTFDEAYLDYNESYKLIVKFNGAVYETPITNATVYYGLTNMVIDYNSLTIVPYPEDYKSYVIIINDIPDEYFAPSHTLQIIYNNQIVAVNNTMRLTPGEETFSIMSNIFRDANVSGGGIQYWVPEANKHYELRLIISDEGDVQVFDYNDFITLDDFTSEMPLSFASFGGEN
jgi:hypothetical protein